MIVDKGNGKGEAVRAAVQSVEECANQRSAPTPLPFRCSIYGSSNAPKAPLLCILRRQDRRGQWRRCTMRKWDEDYGEGTPRKRGADAMAAGRLLVPGVGAANRQRPKQCPA